MGREVEIVGSAVHEAAVVPHDEIARLPAVAIDEARVGGMRQQLGQQRAPLVNRQPLNMRGVVTEIEPLAAGFRMGPDQRMGYRRGVAVLSSSVAGRLPELIRDCAQLCTAFIPSIRVFVDSGSAS